MARKKLNAELGLPSAASMSSINGWNFEQVVRACLEYEGLVRVDNKKKARAMFLSTTPELAYAYQVRYFYAFGGENKHLDFLLKIRGQTVLAEAKSQREPGSAWEKWSHCARAHSSLKWDCPVFVVCERGGVISEELWDAIKAVAEPLDDNVKLVTVEEFKTELRKLVRGNAAR